MKMLPQVCAAIVLIGAAWESIGTPYFSIVLAICGTALTLDIAIGKLK